MEKNRLIWACRRGMLELDILLSRFVETRYEKLSDQDKLRFDVLLECELKEIPIHIDAAWLTLSKDIELDLSHPAIQSIGMGISKYALQWNRVGLRYSKQRKMDSVTIFNKFYIHNCNDNLYDCARFCIERIPRDYMWQTYGELNADMCNKNNWLQTKLIHGVWDNNKIRCITKELDLILPHTK